MELALTINGWMDEEVIFAQQMGAKTVFAQVDLVQVCSPGWDPGSLAGLANRIEKAALSLAGIYSVSASRSRGGQPRLEEAELMEGICRLVKAAGTAGIGLLCPPSLLFRGQPLSGKRSLTMLAVLAEAADQAGVNLAIPAGRLTANQAGDQAHHRLTYLTELLENLQSPFMGLDGTPGLLLELLQENASPVQRTADGLRQKLLDKLFLVSFEKDLLRSVEPTTKQTDAKVDELLTISGRLKQVGYSGLLRVGQPPHWKGDSTAGHRARAFAVGYLRAVLQAFQTTHFAQ